MSRDFSSRRALHSSSDSSNTLVSVSLTHSYPFLSPKPSPKTIYMHVYISIVHIYIICISIIYIYYIYVYTYTLLYAVVRRRQGGDRFQVSLRSMRRARRAWTLLESRASRFEWNCIVRDYGVVRIKERSWKTRDHTSVIWPALSHSAGININKSLDRSPVTSRLSWFLPTT